MMRPDMQLTIRKPDSFPFRGFDIALRWERWKRSFEAYLCASDLRVKPASVQVAALLHTLGVEGQYIYNKIKNHHTETDYRGILDRLTQYCIARDNLMYQEERLDPSSSSVDSHLISSAGVRPNADVSRSLRIHSGCNSGIPDPGCNGNRVRRRSADLMSALEIQREMIRKIGSGGMQEHAGNNEVKYYMTSLAGNRWVDYETGYDSGGSMDFKKERRYYSSSGESMNLSDIEDRDKAGDTLGWGYSTLRPGAHVSHPSNRWRIRKPNLKVHIHSVKPLSPPDSPLSPLSPITPLSPLSPITPLTPLSPISVASPLSQLSPVYKSPVRENKNPGYMENQKVCECFRTKDIQENHEASPIPQANQDASTAIPTNENNSASVQEQDEQKNKADENPDLFTEFQEETVSPQEQKVPTEPLI